MRFQLICNTEKNSRGSSDHRVVNFDFNSGARNGGPCAIPFEASCSSFFLMLLVPGNCEVVEEDDDDEIKWMFEQAEAKACSMAAHSSSSTHSTGIVESLIPLSSSSHSPCLSSIWLQFFLFQNYTPPLLLLRQHACTCTHRAIELQCTRQGTQIPLAFFHLKLKE